MRSRSVDLTPVPADAARVGLRPTQRRWLAGVVLLLVGGGLGLALHQRAPPETAPALRGVRIQSDCNGTITDWILCLPDGDGVFFEETQAELIARADPSIRFHLVHGPDAVRRSFEGALKHAGRDLDRRVRWHKTSARVWPWTRDLFVAAQSQDGTPVTLLHHAEHYATWKKGPTHAEVGLFADLVPGGRILQTSARLEGGSLVADGERVLASPSFVERALARGEGLDAAQIRRRTQELWGLPIELLAVAPVHLSRHCDLVMMPAGDRRMVLASPRVGAELLRETGPAQRTRFVAACRQVGLRAPAGHGAAQLARGEIVSELLVQNSRPELHRAYQALRAHVEALGYRCVEVPGLSLDPRHGGVGAALSYTNVVLDERGKRRTVYLPTYHLPKLDNQAAQAWHELGYRVVRIDALAPGLNGGAIHCLSQVFRAPPAGPRARRSPL